MFSLVKSVLLRLRYIIMNDWLLMIYEYNLSEEQNSFLDSIEDCFDSFLLKTSDDIIISDNNNVL